MDVADAAVMLQVTAPRVTKLPPGAEENWMPEMTRTSPTVMVDWERPVTVGVRLAV